MQILLNMNKTLVYTKDGGKISDLPKLSEITHPKPVSESFLALTKFRLTMNGQIASLSHTISSFD